MERSGMRTLTMRRALGGLGVVLFSAGAGVGGPPGVAEAADYWPMVCQGPLAGARVSGGKVLLRARAGRRPAAPSQGECVWRDRAVDRPGEHRGGFLQIEISVAGGVQVRREGERRETRFSSRALQGIWDGATRGGRFALLVRRVGEGRYAGRVPSRAVAAPARREYPRATAAPSGGARPGPRPSTRETGGAGPRVTARPAPVRDHCIPIDPFRMRIASGPYTRPAGGGWVWVDRNTTVWRVEGDAAAGGTIAVFRDRRLAEQTLRVLRELRADRYCGTKFPHPAMTYLLISGRPPAAPPPGVDCAPMNRARLAVDRGDGRWRVIEHSPRGLINWFVAETRNEAHAAVELIRKHRFNRHCRIGRGEEAFSFLTR